MILFVVFLLDRPPLMFIRNLHPLSLPGAFRVGWWALSSPSARLGMTLLRDVALVVLITAEWAWPGSFDLDALRRDSALAVITLTALFSLVGFWNARRPARVVDI